MRRKMNSPQKSSPINSKKGVRRNSGVGTPLSGKKPKTGKSLRSKTSGSSAPRSKKNTARVRNMADDVVTLVNRERTSRGIPALISDARLGRIAGLKAVDMRDLDYFSHTSPTYGTPDQMLRRFGVTFNSWAENIAWGYQTPESVVAAWMNSPGHRANILNPAYTRTGAGWASGGSRRIVWTQLFTN